MGCTSDRNIIEYFYADRTAHNTFNAYVPDITNLNKQIKNWNKKGICFCGIIHSHLVQKIYLSEADIEYAKRILSALDEEWLWFPLVICINNHTEYYFYKVRKLRKGVLIESDIINIIKDYK